MNIKYFYTYETHVKLRWKNKPLIDVLSSEFRTRSREYYLEALKNGTVTVNSKIVSPNYKLKDLDLLCHTIHMHEPAQPSIDIIKDEDDYVVINKPAGIPVHPTGGYVYYSVTKTLFGDKKVGCVNRLDMPVSGVLIVVLKNFERVHELLDTATKIYVAKVKGDFPDYVEVDQPIGSPKALVHDIDPNGKPSKTLFTKLQYKNGYSLVQCQPITGRTHQIRIHLKYLGFPIVNDILYGEGDEAVQVATDCRCDEDISSFEDQEKYKFIISHCKGENNRSFQIKESYICLHAWKYTFNNKMYEAKWPEWTRLD
jgi:RluA family pseudouridine synthase